MHACRHELAYLYTCLHPIHNLPLTIRSWHTLRACVRGCVHMHAVPCCAVPCRAVRAVRAMCAVRAVRAVRAIHAYSAHLVMKVEWNLHDDVCKNTACVCVDNCTGSYVEMCIVMWVDMSTKYAA